MNEDFDQDYVEYDNEPEPEPDPIRNAPSWPHYGVG